jgi:hypothetical protein
MRGVDGSWSVRIEADRLQGTHAPEVSLRRTAHLLAPVAAALLALSACGDDDDAAPSPAGDDTSGTSISTTTTSPSEPMAATASDLCDDAVLDQTDTAVSSPDLDEISGVVVSRRHDGVLWAHNDSGALPEVFAIGDDGSHLGRYDVDGAEASDWEDLGFGRGPQEHADYLYLGDIGDNFDVPLRLENPIRIYRVPEPEVSGDGADGPLERAVVFDIAYDDGHRDAETLMTDPLSDDLFIVSKQWDGAPAGVYRLPADIAVAEAAPVETVTMERLADVAESAGVWITGGDISVDGFLVALRTYAEVWLWDRDPGRSVAETLADPPTCRREVREPQGEAVAFAEDGYGFVTISEGEHPPILWHRLPER